MDSIADRGNPALQRPSKSASHLFPCTKLFLSNGCLAFVLLILYTLTVTVCGMFMNQRILCGCDKSCFA